VSPEGQFESEERLRALRSAVHDLPDKERRLMELYYLEDRSLGDAAGVLGLSKSWASRLHTRAIELLRVALAKRGYEEASPPSAARAVAVAEVAVDARATAPPSSRRSLLGLRRDG
jgi:RNA polymerase sigma factor for flagellar operon FliA